MRVKVGAVNLRRAAKLNNAGAIKEEAERRAKKEAEEIAKAKEEAKKRVAERTANNKAQKEAAEKKAEKKEKKRARKKKKKERTAKKKEKEAPEATPSETGGAQTEAAVQTEAAPGGGGGGIQTTKSSGMDVAQRRVQIHNMIPEKPAGETRGNTQTTNSNAKPPEEQTLQSGGKYDPTKFLEMSKDKNLGRSERWMLERLGNMRANAQKVFNKGTDEQIKNELGRWGIEAKDGDKVADYMNKIDEMLKEKAESGPTIGDKFRAHHGVGLTGLGVVGVSTLDLANSRGQQSNAQLYSDPFA